MPECQRSFINGKREEDLLPPLSLLGSLRNLFYQYFLSGYDVETGGEGAGLVFSGVVEEADALRSVYRVLCIYAVGSDRLHACYDVVWNKAVAEMRISHAEFSLRGGVSRIIEHPLRYY